MQNFGESVYIGIDLGSSFVKVCIVDQNQNNIKSVRVPQHELQINSPNLGWAQQDPEKWWQVVKQGLNLALNDENINKSKIKGIGISYQMHGLVMVDKEMNVIRPAIIWCDGRATKIGKQLFEKLKERKVDHILLNHPSNFTLVKLLWVKQNQPENYAKIYKIMLPGDFIAMKLSGEIKTTKLGLSQGTFWDYPNDSPCYKILNFLGISQSILPELVENFTSQSLTAITNILPQNIPIYYRSGDQPNNAFSLNVMNPGQIAATGGTSGVIYAISNKIQCKEILKFNSFFHVNHCAQNVRIGKLLCISGCGSVYRWVRDNFCAGLSYEQMNEMAELCQSDGVVVIPFGNGPERMLNNDQVGCHVLNINFMNHKLGNIIRGYLQGIAFSFVYGANLLRQEKIQITTMKAGKGNIFESSLFCQILSNALNVSIQLYETSGAEGAAKAAIMGQRQSKQNKKEIDFSTSPTMIHKFTPNQEQVNKYKTLYENWQQHLKSLQGQIKA